MTRNPPWAIIGNAVAAGRIGPQSSPRATVIAGGQDHETGGLMDTVESSDEWPFGYGKCHCGCGRKTRIATNTDHRYGHVNGQPVRYVNRHGRRKSRLGDWPVLHEDRGFQTPCHVWYGGRAEGYGVYFANGKRTSAHRFAYQQKFGPVDPGMHLDHLCRVTECCNPDHLEVVTNAVNTQRGDTARLSPAAVRSIRSDRRSLTQIASSYGVNRQTVANVKNGTSWKNVDQEAA